MSQKRRKTKWLLSAEGIVFYLALLNIISHIRGPVPYQVDTSQSIIQIQDFIPMAEMGVSATETVLPIYNTVDGTVAGYTAPLVFQDLECLTIQFQVNCPPEFEGNTLIVDLYNYEAQYDNPDQEHHVVLQAGTNNISFELLPGDAAPETGELRFFTVNTADYEIEKLQVHEKTAMPKVTSPMVAAVIVLAILWMATLCYMIIKKKNDRT